MFLPVKAIIIYLFQYYFSHYKENFVLRDLVLGGTRCLNRIQIRIVPTPKQLLDVI